MIVIYLYGLVFKTFEDFDPTGTYSQFSNIENCIWFVIVTMTTIGYGEYTPVTMVGRIIIVTCCIVGVFMISLIFSSFVVLTDLENSEQNVFDQIEFFHMKEKKDNDYDSYMNDFIKYKFSKFSKSKGLSVDSLVQKYNLDVKRKGVIHQIYKQEKRGKMILEDLSNTIYKSWENVDDYLIYFDQMSPQLLEKSDKIKDAGFDLRDELKTCQKLSFQIFNLTKFYNTCGGLVEVKNINEINSKNMIQTERLIKDVISFMKVHKEKKVKIYQIKENGISNKFDEFYNLENVEKLKNKLSDVSIPNSDSIERNTIIKSSIINRVSLHSENASEKSPHQNEEEEENKPLGVIDEESSDWDN